MKLILVLLIVILGNFQVPGQTIESFTLPDVTTGNDFSLAALKNEKAIVLIFYSGKCAYSEYYFERIISLKREFSSQGVSFILINSNSSSFVPEESVTEMKTFTDTNNLDMPYLADKTKDVKNILMATRTPEVFILKPDQEGFTVLYKGAIDDSPQSASDVSHSYLRETLVLLLKNNRVSVNQTRAVGCLIK